MPDPQKPAPQADPWADAAKNFKPQPGGTTAPEAGNDDWKIWQQGASGDEGAANQGVIPKLQHAFDDAVKPESYSMADGVTGNAGKAFRNLGGGLLSLATPLVHPEETAKAAWRMSPPGMAMDSFSGKPTIGQDVAKQLIPQKDESAGQYGGRMAGGATSAAGAFLGGAGLGELKVPSLNLGERFGGYKSPVIPNALQSASKAAEAIRPPGGIMPDFEQNLATNLPKIKGFADESGNPLHSQWETSEAARGLANKGLEHFRTNFMDPVGNEQISMRSVPEYQGPVSGEGRMTTLGQLEKRISDINDMQRAAMKGAKTQGAQMSAEQALGLENEAGKLRDILYQEIGKRTGVEPSVIRDLRQSYGQQFNIADTIDAARRTRLGQTGAAAEMGGSVPFSKTGILEKAMQGIRGGQDYIANARLRKALQSFEPESPQYPTPKAPEPGPPMRQPLAKQVGIEPGPNPLQPVTMEPPPNYAQSFVDRRRAMPAPEPPTPQNPLDKYMGRARESQSQARTLRRTP